MKRMLFSVVPFLASAGIACAASACTSGAMDVSWSSSMECGGVTFTHFDVISTTPGTIPVAFVSSSVVADSLRFAFNPGSGSDTPLSVFSPQGAGGTPALTAGAGGGNAIPDRVGSEGTGVAGGLPGSNPNGISLGGDLGVPSPSLPSAAAGDPASVPEPASAVLVVTGLLGFFAVRKRLRAI